MAQIVVRGIDEGVMRVFRERARERGVSAEQAVRELIEQAAGEALRTRDWHTDATVFRERLRAKYGTLPSSAELIRDDRDVR